MSKVARQTVFLLGTALLVGCSAIRGAPEAPRSATVAAADPEFLVEPARLKGYADESDPERKKIIRNEIIDERVLEIDNQFGKYEVALWQQGVGAGIGTDWVLLGLSAATATTGGAVLKSALGAVSTGVTGAKASFDKNAFFDKTLLAVLAQMSAERDKVRASIERSKQLSVADYTIYAALGDLRRLIKAGTIPGGIQTVAADAGAKAAAAEKDIKDIRSGKFMRDDAGDRLRAFWKPDGTNIDPTNEALLKQWMQQNGLAVGAGDITFFLRDEGLADMRVRAARKLLRQ